MLYIARSNNVAMGIEINSGTMAEYTYSIMQILPFALSKEVVYPSGKSSANSFACVHNLYCMHNFANAELQCMQCIFNRKTTTA